MGAAYFYHLTRRPLVETLRMLLSKSLENDWNVAVRGTDVQALADLDRVLWLGPEEEFLPHAMAGGDDDALQPVLLTTAETAENAPDCVMSVHGAAVTVEEVAALQRVCVLFDGEDEAALNVARGQWKALKAAGASAQYWSEESGRWEKKAET
ncbi:DNA polymerase III subunit chi [Sulfitobacter sp. M57]|uniref:DNA polymerase III subunit chi n=1 Tax=unclassified Sulfitobacter TaxID=196795 RepID=UPI0023E0A3C8|nr:MULTISPECIES: DNA polymerase III subunit chi [unclassified Sulfitobacter]MDF3413883.1 DNA polymerase III subunit chi [Sulfitobacter sp. KE5]MDF3420836.1 DNA polymerase III subunit chi [Sulfitobacter sp. KE43]MDF3432429.1 DNA polymerase III subunit chi [Sulfitobacter sp. KE42]MDF3458068.1 DNA polymerase III subunit chi [Sulfitobacter sp. S74]MDF3461969.1 DNA polymerase III subunit chi [Sulfitobacter sp. Ks18]